ncbi:MAG: UDP-3-O-acyl-N-acetylglucosamine deacetylase [Myxococcota bacterium]
MVVLQSSVEFLRGAGIRKQGKARRYLRIKREVRVDNQESWARLVPGQDLRITCLIDFDHPLISTTPYIFDFSEESFCADIAPARTFGFMRDVKALRAHGLALGGSLDNAIVIDGDVILNREGLRFVDEFARHKVLDAIGDLSLVGMPVIGHLELHRSGHALNTRLVKELLDDPDSYEIVEPVLEAPSRAPRPRAFESVEGTL